MWLWAADISARNTTGLKPCPAMHSLSSSMANHNLQKVQQQGRGALIHLLLLLLLLCSFEGIPSLCVSVRIGNRPQANPVPGQDCTQLRVNTCRAYSSHTVSGWMLHFEHRPLFGANRRLVGHTTTHSIFPAVPVTTGRIWPVSPSFIKVMTVSVSMLKAVVQARWHFNPCNLDTFKLKVSCDTFKNVDLH